MINLNNKNILVLGLQKSGLAVIRLLKTLNLQIYVTDKVITTDISGTIYLEYDKLNDYLGIIDIIVKSPGIPYDIPILVEARKKQIIITNEIEIAYQFIDKSKVIVGITGTNGKTTTTSLVTAILKASNIDAISVGNIGYTLSEAILEQNTDVYVVELSSFQLLDIIDFKPHISIILNFSEAHLDYHHTYEHYINAKLNIVRNICDDDIIIYNYDDELVKAKMDSYRGQKYSFSLKNKNSDSYLDQNKLYISGSHIINIEEIKLLGSHNLYNILAAITCAKAFYIENQIINTALKDFISLPHRIQFIKKVNNISYYNDSKSTNSTSTICALNAFNIPVILILGGFERNQDFTDIITHQNTKLVIAFGETKERIITKTLKLRKESYACDDLRQAILLTQKLAKNDDIVLFSPASASWDQYKDYEERGESFINLVNNLSEFTNT